MLVQLSQHMLWPLLHQQPFTQRPSLNETSLRHMTCNPFFNLLIDKIALDSEFLLEILKPVSKVDDFLAHLIEIFEATSQSVSNQPIRLGIHRSDYILHYDAANEMGDLDGQNLKEVINFFSSNKFKLLQVEINTIASSFGSLSSLTTGLHKFLSARTGNFWGNFPSENPQSSPIPENNSLLNIAKGLAQAHSLYGSAQAAVLFIVQEGERNVFDQRHIELALFQRYGIIVIRKTLLQAKQDVHLGPDDKLYIDTQEISVVYFRSGYSPDDYPSAVEWEARLILEKSRAVKCPNIAYHLTGSKKIQQVLAQPGVLERFISDPQHLDLIRQCFAGLYPLDYSPEGDAAFQKALQSPSRFVMKPSREGGGNNIYGEDIVSFLQSLPENDPSRSAYILMDRILPPHLINNNVGLRFGQPRLRGNFVSELGIYGVFLTKNDDVSLNLAGGHLLRTKLDSSNEGGVAVGHSVIDSPYLV
ncbi:Glutathione synthetase [Entomophthora muscae]|uniref:Glutathione synthetase n=1 Tax=Entomophthora muscae TaxID=34485 RepID=A0ACC2USV4_9FUNG|nr:Glutathione synthetase [Entomophthora muscae]